jgi:POT family proton-dependent oligopeptide transporter
LICGYLGQNINWHVGFGAACFFMILGQIQFITGVKKTRGLPPDVSKLKEKIVLHLLDRESIIYLFSLAVVAMVVLLLQYPRIMNYIMLPITACAFAYVFIISLRFSEQERSKVFAANTFFLISSLFWACFEQCSGSLSLFVLHNVNLNIAGIQLSGL